MATTAVRPLTCCEDRRLAHFRSWELQWQPLVLHRRHRRARSAQNWRCFASTQNGVNWRFTASIQNEEGAQNWRCFSSTQYREPAQNLRCFASTQSGEEGSELEVVPAGSLAEVEKEKPGYIGRALRAGKGAVIADLLQIFEHLLERPYGGGESVANAGAVVIERVVSDAQALRGQEGVSDQVIFEMLKVIRFLEMDMDLVRAAKKEETLLERLETAKKHCRQAFLIASSF